VSVHYHDDGVPVAVTLRDFFAAARSVVWLAVGERCRGVRRGAHIPTLWGGSFSPTCQEG
jgi:hypothetical protein